MRGADAEVIDWLRLMARLLGMLVWLLLGLLTVMVVFPVVSRGARGVMVQHWSRWFMRCFGVTVVTHGQAVLKGAVLTVANHVSWIDVFVLNSVRATCFIAKHEIRRWPLIGALVAGAGAVFIERGQRHAIKAVSQAMGRCFDQGEAVGLFPESTTSLGWQPLPFHASLFAPACAQAVAVQPVALRFMRDGKRSDYAAFVGDESLIANVWRVLMATGLSVEATYLPPLPMCDVHGQALSRQRLAHVAHAAIAQVLD